MNLDLMEILLTLTRTELFVTNLKTDDEIEKCLKQKSLIFANRRDYFIKEIAKIAIKSIGTVEKTAEACDVSVETIKKIKSGTRFPSRDLWIKFALILHIPGDNRFIELFMQTAGYALNTAYFTDFLYYYAIRKGLSIEKTNDLIGRFADNNDLKYFFEGKDS